MNRSIRSKVALLPGALALGVVGCGEVGLEPPLVDEDSQAITRAAPTPEVPGVVRLKRISPMDDSCTASILSPHWLLTAAHCVTGSTGGQVRVMKTVSSETTGVGHEVYEGPAKFVPHPSYDKPWYGLDAGDDFGLVFLPNGLGSAGADRVRLFIDARLPWTGSAADRQFSYMGWGRGTNVGGSDDCDDGSVGIKRMGTATLIGTTASAIHVESNRGATHLCPGDSGGPWMVKRGTSPTPMVFAVSSGYHPLDDNDYAGLVHKKLDWIESASKAYAFRLEPSDSFTDGWKFRRFNEVSNPLPPPPPPPAPTPCPSGQICCEPAGAGACSLCIPAGSSCP